MEKALGITRPIAGPAERSIPEVLSSKQRDKPSRKPDEMRNDCDENNKENSNCQH